MTTAVWDFDYIKYAIGSIAEKRTVLVTHKQSGNVKEFKTRTEFYGHYKTKSGGWLAEQNKGRLTPFVADDFIIEDVQTPEPVHIAINAVDRHIKSVLNKINVDSYYGYIGKGDSWRLEKSTILKYKGGREDTLKPIHLPAIEEHLAKNHAAELITHLEADDKVIMDCTENPEFILVGVDKDYHGSQCILFNPDKMIEPKKISGFGKLSIGADKKVRGEGRIFLYHQVLSGDSSDNYYANSASDVKWADKGSYSVLVECNNDRQALQAMVGTYKKLYPASKTITGWRGDSIDIDWKYVMQENFTMAHMLRHENDFFDLDKTLNKLNISY